MKTVLFSVLFLIFTSTVNAANLQGFGIIREFGASDTAAMFGLLPISGTLKITSVAGPSFLSSVGYGVGQLNNGVISHLFLKSSNPMSQLEKQNLLSKYNGATIIYIEDYTGNLCTSEEIEYSIVVTGTVDTAPFTATIQFIALPNSSGDCTYHKFGTIIQD